MKNILQGIIVYSFIFLPAIVEAQSFTLLKDINPGGVGSGPSVLNNINGTILLAADDGIHGRELWKTNGLSAGTQLFYDINPIGSSNPEFALEFNGNVFFTANDGVHGSELWKSDGLLANTVLLKDINPSGDCNASSYFIFNSELYFIADDGVHGLEIWKSNGTEAGTILVKDINLIDNPNVSFGPKINGLFFFLADDGIHGQELWKSDGSEAGTGLVNDINLQGSSNIGSIYTNQNLLFFYADDGTHGRELWRSDGTENGTILLNDILPGIRSSGPERFTIANNLVFFTATNGESEIDPPFSNDLWRTDGTIAGTFLLKKINGDGESHLEGLINLNEQLFYFGNDEVLGGCLFKSDGTVNGTTLVKVVTLGGRYEQRRVINGLLFFTGLDEHGSELWTSDGTEEGTNMVVDLTPGPDGSFSGIQVPYLAHNKYLYFTHVSPCCGSELWRSDGTAAGTIQVKDIWPGPAPNQQRGFDLFFFNFFDTRMLILGANDGIHGIEPWLTNGSESGTNLVQDFEEGTGDSKFWGWWEINGTLYFSIESSLYGSELWVSSLSALPISLFDFTGHLVGKDAKLNWKTTGEEKNSSYVLERGFDRINFAPVATIAAHLMPGTNAYDYTDINIAQSGKAFAYYRIRQIEPGRQSSYSNIVAIRMSGGSYWVKIQPNPVSAQLNIQMNSNKPEHSTMSIVSMQGVVLMKKEITIRTGMQSISWDINRLPAGSYLLTIQDDEKITKEMFIKN